MTTKPLTLADIKAIGEEADRLKRAKGIALRDQQARKANAARAMLAILKETIEQTDWAMNPDYYDRMEAAIEQAEQAGIATGEDE